MATELDKLIVKIEADLKDLKKGMAQANKEVQSASKLMSSGMTRFNNTLTKTRASLLKFGAVAGVAFGAVALRNIIKTGMEIQSLEIRFNSLFGSVNEGNKAFEQLLEYAGTVPFSLGEIQAGSGSLAVVAKDAEHLRDIMEITGNVAVIAGLDFRTTASQIQRVFSGGLAAADIFREKGISQIIRDTGMMVDTVEGAALAFESVFSGNGKFAKATEDMAVTVEGTLSMVGDTLQAFTIAIAEGFFIQLGKSLTEFNQMLQNNRQQIVEYGKELGQNLGEALKTVQENFDLIINSIKIFISLQLASVFYNFSKAIQVATASQIGFNAAAKANPYILGASALIAIGSAVAMFFDLEKAMDAVTNAYHKATRAVRNFFKELFTGEKSAGERFASDFNARSRATGGGNMTQEDVKLFLKHTAHLHESEEKKITKLTNKEYHERQKNMAIYMDTMAEANALMTDNQLLLLDTVMERFEKVGENISQAFGEALISGKDFKDGMVDIFQSVLQQVTALIFELYVIKPLLDSIKTSMQGSGFLESAAGLFMNLGGGSSGRHIDSGSNFGAQYFGTRQGGGSVNPNMPYMVGERGAELFVPKSAGTIMPNAKMSGGQPVIINQTLDFAVGVSETVQAEVLNLLPTIQQSTLQVVQEARLRGGRFAKDFGA